MVPAPISTVKILPIDQFSLFKPLEEKILFRKIGWMVQMLFSCRGQDSRRDLQAKYAPGGT
jgi:hypothetical protein